MRRTILTVAAIVVLVALVALVVLVVGRRAEQPVGLALINGKVLTVDRNDTVMQAIGVSDGRIVAVGSNDEVRRRIGSATQVIDLHGRAVTPGLIDTHVHFSEADALYTIDLSDGVTRIDDVLTRVRDQVAHANAGEWIRGRGWDEGKLAERRYVTAADLDKVAPNNPVYLTNTTGHYGVANSYGLRLAGVTKTTADPPAGTIDRDAKGNPTGVMKEAAQSLVRRLIPPLTREQQKNGLLKIVQDFNREGMTGAKDPGIGPDKWELYQELLKEDRLTVRAPAQSANTRR